jgi:hypothetical protein
MQYAVLDKVNPIITKHQALLFQRHSNTTCNDARHQVLSGIDQGLCNLTVDSAADREAMQKPVSEVALAQEEQQAFHRHFQNIAIGRFCLASLLCLCMLVTYQIRADVSVERTINFFLIFLCQFTIYSTVE